MRLQALTTTLLLAASFAGAERIYVHDKAGRLTEIKDVDLQNDPLHCGKPDNPCELSETCQAGKCVACNPLLDYDCDGRPNITDNCLWHKNWDQHDGDLDGVGTACDNCPAVKNKDQLNTDGDKEGDACDDDDDNDGCEDVDDDKPTVDASAVAWRIAAACPDQVQKVWSWDGYDVDMDGLRNCNKAETDDDNDGVPDLEDICPINPGNSELDCQRSPVSCPLTTIEDACQFGGCNQFLIQIVSVIYPPLIVQHFTIRAEVVLLIPMLQLGIQQMEAALVAAEGGGGAFASSPSRAAGLMRVELWSKDEEGRPKELVATIAEYEPSAVEVREPVGDGALLLTPLEGGRAIAIQRGYVPMPEH
jgi:hypothetical protein